VNARPVIAAPLTFVNVIVIAVGVFAATVEVAKDLLTWGLAICNVAAACAVFAPPLVVRPPTGIVLP